MSRGRVIRAFFAFAVAASFAILAPSEASATVAGPCIAQLAGIDITADHDTAKTAVKVDYGSEVAYSGEATDGSVITEIAVTLEILGVRIKAHGGSANGSTWSSTANIKKYAWAGIGLYLVKGTSSTSSGPLCSGSAYMCVQGKSFFLTVAGVLATLLALLSLIWLIRGLVFRRRRTEWALRIASAEQGCWAGPRCRSSFSRAAWCR